mmetsp:Transcript_29525/g.89327  ORF Transcript_29525/g.89327 Transcript_29525/m.89327 type:complete len:227 (-) Transcript_29525:63-743(-)
MLATILCSSRRWSTSTGNATSNWPCGPPLPWEARSIASSTLSSRDCAALSWAVFFTKCTLLTTPRPNTWLSKKSLRASSVLRSLGTPCTKMVRLRGYGICASHAFRCGKKRLIASSTEFITIQTTYQTAAVWNQYTQDLLVRFDIPIQPRMSRPPASPKKCIGPSTSSSGTPKASSTRNASSVKTTSWAWSRPARAFTSPKSAFHAWRIQPRGALGGPRPGGDSAW